MNEVRMCFKCKTRKECRIFWHGYARTGMMDMWVCKECDKNLDKDAPPYIEKVAYMHGVAL